MRIVFVQSVSENFAVEIFSSLLKAQGHQCFLVYDQRLFNSGEINNPFLFNLFDIRENLIDEVEFLRPDLIAFSVLTDQYQWALNMARRIKERIRAPIIFGGAHVTMVPDIVIENECVDMICVGEGEKAIVELVTSMQKGAIDYSIQNLWLKKDGNLIKNVIRPLIADLDTIPFPDKQLFYEKERSLRQHYAVLSGRGCPYNCTYCATSVIKLLSSKKERFVRRRTPHNVIEELLQAKNNLKGELKCINFLDDTFTYDYEWLREFCALYKEKINLTFHCTAYPNTVTYEKTSLLKDAGCYRIGIGVQSVSEKTRKEVLNRPGSNDLIRRAATACKEAGLSFWIDHILNIPYETEEDQLEALKFYNEIRPPVINVFWLVYYPNTKIIEIGKNAGLLNDETIRKINRGETGTSFVVGIGGTYSFAKERVYANFSFLFNLLPLIPKKWMDIIIRKKMFMSPRFKPMLLSNVIIKLLVRARLGQSSESLWIVRILLKNSYKNVAIKLFKTNLRRLKKLRMINDVGC